MTFRHSLRTRIIIAFCLFGAVLGTVYAFAVYISLDLIDDHLVDNRLIQEIEHIVFHHRQYNDLPPPTSSYITAYIDTASMPPHVREMVVGMTEGFHEAYHGRDEYHIAVQSLPNLDKFFYLLYVVSDTGMGIAAENLRTVTKPHVRGSDSEGFSVWDYPS